jgi:uncharacterized protein with FMN-binding domain
MRKFVLCVLAGFAVMLAAILDKAASTPAEHSELADTSTAYGTRSALGPAIPLAHGMVQVEVTTMGSRIVGVKAVQLPHDNDHSWEDSEHAASVLRSEVLSRQSADLHAVSGATYTSEAYLKSLNAALELAAPPAPTMSPVPQLQ